VRTDFEHSRSSSRRTESISAQHRFVADSPIAQSRYVTVTFLRVQVGPIMLSANSFDAISWIISIP
jgi:hypothetical protein